MDLDPIHFLRRRRRFRQDIEQEVAGARSRHGDNAYYRMVETLARPDLGGRHRQVLQAAARRLRSERRRAESEGPARPGLA